MINTGITAPNGTATINHVIRSGWETQNVVLEAATNLAAPWVSSMKAKPTVAMTHQLRPTRGLSEKVHNVHASAIAT
jgi:hypothetical protein